MALVFMYGNMLKRRRHAVLACGDELGDQGGD
jgi:hypothetical protein